MEYASKAVGTAGLTTGIIGTALGALDAMGGLAGLLGGRQPAAPEDRPVTRYEMGLIKESLGKDNEIALLKANGYTDRVNAGVQMQISQQNAWNAAQGVNIMNIQTMLNKLVQPMIPNGSVSPGWGPAFVSPFPPTPPVAPEAKTTTTSTTGTT